GARREHHIHAVVDDQRDVQRPEHLLQGIGLFDKLPRRRARIANLDHGDAAGHRLAYRFGEAARPGNRRAGDEIKREVESGPHGGRDLRGPGMAGASPRTFAPRGRSSSRPAFTEMTMTSPPRTEERDPKGRRAEKNKEEKFHEKAVED